MEILYILIPMSVILVLIIVVVLARALHQGQFDDLQHQGEIIFEPEERAERAAALRARRDAELSASRNNPRPSSPPIRQLDLGQRSDRDVGA
jgi:cbb3-type cytochrome oxidase maturation protein